MDVALRVEGEGGGGVTAFSGPARRTQAGVAVFSIIGQYRDATCSMLTLVLLAADQKDVTVSPAPRLLARLWHGAVTPIGVGSVFTRGAILAGITLALVDVLLTVYTCMERHSRLVLQLTLTTLIQLFSQNTAFTWITKEVMFYNNLAIS